MTKKDEELLDDDWLKETLEESDAKPDPAAEQAKKAPTTVAKPVPKQPPPPRATTEMPPVKTAITAPVRPPVAPVRPPVAPVRPPVAPVAPAVPARPATLQPEGEKKPNSLVSTERKPIVPSKSSVAAPQTNNAPSPSSLGPSSSSLSARAPKPPSAALSPKTVPPSLSAPPVPGLVDRAQTAVPSPAGSLATASPLPLATASARPADPAPSSPQAPNSSVDLSGQSQSSSSLSPQFKPLRSEINLKLSPLRRALDSRRIEAKTGLDSSTCVFWIGKQSYAIDTSLVLEAVAVEEIVPVPLTAPQILGIFSLRGLPVAMVDLANLMNLPRSPHVGQSHIAIVLRTEGMTAALRVDRLEVILPSNHGRFSKREDGSETDPVRGFLELDHGRIVAVLDTAALVRALDELKYRTVRTAE